MTDLAPDEKRCPFCAEVIKKAALKCRWCGSDLPADFADMPVESAADTREAGGERARGPRLLTAVLAIALLAAIAGSALAIKHANDSQVAPDGELASSAVRAGIMEQAGAMTATAMSYRAAESQADIAAAEKLMTPAMRTKYEADLPPESQRADQAKMKVTIKASVASLSGSKSACRSDDCAVSIVSATEDRARVLVFVNQNASASSTTHTVASPQWELLTLVKRGDTWLIDDMASS